MSSTGLITKISDFFISISTELSFPILFFSAALVNIFVPSGGGQWAVQGPIIIEAATQLGVSLPKSIMALAYGDQITNMLQPFWALPLLGITGLKARKDYTLYPIFTTHRLIHFHLKLVNLLKMTVYRLNRDLWFPPPYEFEDAWSGSHWWRPQCGTYFTGLPQWHLPLE
ncbi:MAG: TIGR00366 family protein [Owenweeksia sp.]|nr:TIGR00366 family protein [Owenweeksia sp.]